MTSSRIASRRSAATVERLQPDPAVERARSIRSPGGGCDARTCTSRGGQYSARFVAHSPSSARANASGSPATSKPKASAARSRRREYAAATSDERQPDDAEAERERREPGERAAALRARARPAGDRRATPRGRSSTNVETAPSTAKRHRSPERWCPSSWPSTARTSAIDASLARRVLVDQRVREHDPARRPHAHDGGVRRRRLGARLEHAHRSDRDAGARREPEQVVAQRALRERTRAQEDRHEQHRRHGGHQQLDGDRAGDRDRPPPGGSTRASQTTAATATVPKTSASSPPLREIDEPLPDALARDADLAREPVARDPERQQHELEHAAHDQREDERVDDQRARGRRARRRAGSLRAARAPPRARRAPPSRHGRYAGAPCRRRAPRSGRAPERRLSAGLRRLQRDARDAAQTADPRRRQRGAQAERARAEEGPVVAAGIGAHETRTVRGRGRTELVEGEDPREHDACAADGRSSRCRARPSAAPSRPSRGRRRR